MWWNLPTEIVDRIVELVSFLDYVALTQTSRTLRSLLDNRHLLLVTLSSTYGRTITAYEWDSVAEAPSRALLWEKFCRLLLFLLDVERRCATTYNLLALNERRTSQDHTASDIEWRKLMHEAIIVYACDPAYFLPLMTELQLCWHDFREKAHDPVPDVSLTRLCWTRKLLELQNFSKAVRFFLKVDPESTLELEQCYFELSRCHLDFDRLAPLRTAKIAEMQAKVRVTLPIQSGELRFPSFHAYEHFIRALVETLAPCLTFHNTARTGMNILRVYNQELCNAKHMYFAILAKVLQETVFDRLLFNVQGRAVNIQAKVTPMFLMMDSFCVLVDLDFNSLSFYRTDALRGLAASGNSTAFRPLTHRDIIYSAFEVPETAHSLPTITSLNSWSNAEISTSKEKLRFLRTLLVPVMEEKNIEFSLFSTLLRKNEFYLYYNCVLAHLQRTDFIFFDYWDSLIQRIKSAEPSAEQIRLGTVVVNSVSDYVGAIVSFYNQSEGAEEKTSIVLPHDQVELSFALTPSITVVNAADLEDNLAAFLEWLMSNEGATHLGMFLFPRLIASNPIVFCT